MATKVMKYQIIKPIDCDWDMLGRILRDIQYDTRQIMNKTIQLCWEYQGFSADYKNAYGVYPKASEIFDYKTLDGYCDKVIREQYTRLYTANLSTTLRKAIKRWKTDLPELTRGQKSIASFKADIPIDLHNKSITVECEGKNYYAVLALASNSYKKELERDRGRFKVLINPGDFGGEEILQRCIDSIYKISASQILNKKNKWFLNLSYSFENTPKTLDDTRVLGIDMGIVYPVYMSVYGTMIRGKIDGGEIEQFRNQVEKRKNELYRQGKYCGEGRIGHGIKTRIKPIRFAQDKVSNFRETVNHKYSRYIVDFAVKNNCGVIQMEDLTGISTDNVFLKKWTYYDLQQKLTYKAEEKGIKVVLINPKYTSQRCSRCGNIDPANRPEQKVFKCTKCEFESNADYNASQNIAIPGIENLISNFINANRK
jgi:IS605 OrfB family transposase